MIITRTELNNLNSFFTATQGNWRNAIYIECMYCPFKRYSCLGYLLTADENAKPIIISVDQFQILTGEIVERDECIMIINRQTFDCLYNRWLSWHISDKNQCSILQLIEEINFKR